MCTYSYVKGIKRTHKFIEISEEMSCSIAFAALRSILFMANIIQFSVDSVFIQRTGAILEAHNGVQWQ